MQSLRKNAPRSFTLLGHDDRYAVEQLQMALFPDNPEGTAESALHRGTTWLTATAKITLNGKTVTASRRLKAAEETVRLRRRILQQSYYLAAVQLLPKVPAWGAWSVTMQSTVPSNTASRIACT